MMFLVSSLLLVTEEIQISTLFAGDQQIHRTRFHTTGSEDSWSKMLHSTQTVSETDLL